jgi:hypothetical protein
LGSSMLQSHGIFQFRVSRMPGSPFIFLCLVWDNVCVCVGGCGMVWNVVLLLSSFLVASFLASKAQIFF